MIPGLTVLENVREPQRQLPKDVSGLKIALKMTGGVGDSIMAIGGPARDLASRGAIITAITMKHAGELIQEMVGVEDWLESQKFNNPAVRSKYDVLIDFAGTFNTAKYLREEPYYELVSRRVGFGVVPGAFKFKHEPEGRRVAIHPGASNPNRRWDVKRWQQLAYEIRERDCEVVFLGTRDEPGFNDKGISKASDRDSNLLWQAKVLAKCCYFIGCDSGFVHIAGVLGVPGVVLFGNTSAKTVISSYPSLKGIEKFEGGLPTRSLTVGCKKSKENMQAITVGDVIAATPLAAVETNGRALQRPKEAEKMKIALVGVPNNEIVHFLKNRYEVVVYGNMPKHNDNDVLVVFSDEVWQLHTKSGKKYRVRQNQEDLVRAIREITGE